MKQNYILSKVVFILFISYCFISCNTEDRKIKKALKQSALNEGAKYELKEYRIIETIMKSNLEDSIKNSEVSIVTQQKMMKIDSLLLNKYIAEKKQSKNEQQNTLRHLSSLYDDIIEDWQEMIDEQEKKLKEKQEKIDKIKKDIKGWKSLIHKAETPIIYYVIKHQYTLDGKQLEKKVLLTTEYKTL